MKIHQIAPEDGSVTSSELSDTADPRSVPSDSSEATPIEVRPPSLGRSRRGRLSRRSHPNP